MVRLLADTGLRLSELVELRTTDVVSRGRDGVYLHIRGKGEKDRLVPIPGLHGRVQRYMQYIRPNSLSDRLFMAARRRGPGHGYEPLTDSGVHQVVRNLPHRRGWESPPGHPASRVSQ